MAVDFHELLPLRSILYQIRDIHHISKHQTSEEHNALRPDSWSRKLKAEMARFAQAHPGIHELTAHELRHTYGTYLRRHGADIYSISKILGHRDINVTARIYVHNELSELRKAVRWCNRRDPIKEDIQ